MTHKNRFAFNKLAPPTSEFFLNPIVTDKKVRQYLLSLPSFHKAIQKFIPMCRWFYQAFISKLPLHKWSQETSLVKTNLDQVNLSLTQMNRLTVIEIQNNKNYLEKLISLISAFQDSCRKLYYNYNKNLVQNLPISMSCNNIIFCWQLEDKLIRSINEAQEFFPLVTDQLLQLLRDMKNLNLATSDHILERFEFPKMMKQLIEVQMLNFFSVVLVENDNSKVFVNTNHFGQSSLFLDLLKLNQIPISEFKSRFQKDEEQNLSELPPTTKSNRHFSNNESFYYYEEEEEEEEEETEKEKEKEKEKEEKDQEMGIEKIREIENELEKELERKYKEIDNFDFETMIGLKEQNGYQPKIKKKEIQSCGAISFFNSDFGDYDLNQIFDDYQYSQPSPIYHIDPVVKNILLNIYLNTKQSFQDSIQTQYQKLSLDKFSKKNERKYQKFIIESAFDPIIPRIKIENETEEKDEQEIISKKIVKSDLKMETNTNKNMNKKNNNNINSNDININNTNNPMGIGNGNLMDIEKGNLIKIESESKTKSESESETETKTETEEKEKEKEKEKETEKTIAGKDNQDENANEPKGKRKRVREREREKEKRNYKKKKKNKNDKNELKNKFKMLTFFRGYDKHIDYFYCRTQINYLLEMSVKFRKECLVICFQKYPKNINIGTQILGKPFGISALLENDPPEGFPYPGYYLISHGYLLLDNIEKWTSKSFRDQLGRLHYRLPTNGKLNLFNRSGKYSIPNTQTMTNDIYKVLLSKPRKKVVNLITDFNCIELNPRNFLAIIYMGRIWRDLKLDLLNLACFAPGPCDDYTHNPTSTVWSEITKHLQNFKLPGVKKEGQKVPYLDNDLSNNEKIEREIDMFDRANKKLSTFYQSLKKNKVIKSVESIPIYCEKTDEPYNDYEFVKIFLNGSINVLLKFPKFKILYDEIMFLLKHLTRSNYMITFQNCGKCDHCKEIPIKSTNIWNFLQKNHHLPFVPAPSKTPFHYETFVQASQRNAHPNVDTHLPSLIRNLNHIVPCQVADCKFVALTEKELHRHIIVFHPDFNSIKVKTKEENGVFTIKQISEKGKEYICTFVVNGEKCGKKFPTAWLLRKHKKETGHALRRGRPKKSFN
ncbi:hypothetical protein M0812_22578 [Anaeramoeba flamelloides]|uniref:C2H2-type domain-containing protein n=1 Tax=Anaeramoeba flamelloides TaxID=1746091 RepID=A0AAV7YY34_9EUKA|nr:hypothetical protein M0812_22578 [Anaeramoeba flamelloides]